MTVNNHKRYLIVCISVICFAALVSADEIPGNFAVIQEITIIGNQTVSIDMIEHLIKLSPGARFIEKDIRRDVKTLYASGLFEDIRVESEMLDVGYRLIFTVKEYPIIHDIVISGASSIGLNTLRDELTISTGDRYNPVTIQQSATKIEQKYRDKGFNFAVVTPRLTPTQLGLATLIFDIDEGTKLKIREVTIKGNKNISTGTRLWGLKSKIKKNQKWWWLSFITDSGIFKEEELKEDIKGLEQYYKNRGYLRVSISEPKITLNRPEKPGSSASLSIAYEVDEGDVYTLGQLNYKVADPSVVPESVVKRVVESTRPESYEKYFGGSALWGEGLRFQTGRRYSLALEELAIKALTEIYGSLGYVYAYISPEKKIDDRNKTVDITFSIIEGKQAFLNRLEFMGNYRTKDRVLRRNFIIAEGSVFNMSQLQSSIARLQYLAYIDNVVPDIEPQVDPTKINVMISLADNRQTEIQLAGGYSGYNKLYGTLGLSEHNLFGRGQELNVSATSGSRSDTIKFSFIDEWVMDRPYYGSVSAWSSREKYDSSTQRKQGGSIFIGRGVGSIFSTRLGYTFENNRVYDISASADENVKKLEGTQITSSLTHLWILNTLNNKLDPTKGWYGTVSFQFAGGILGGDNDFYKAYLSVSKYWSLPRRLVFSLQGRFNYGAGLRGKELPYYELFRLGGPYTVRGYRDYGIGPIGEGGLVLGGNKSLLLSSELQIPIARPLKIVFFVDAGDAWSSEDAVDLRTLRPSTGFEIRFFMPGFGIPLRFIWGYNLDPYENESRNDFQFTMGRMF
ncbi:MAG: outer membrane protein assembly factor BamA [bacterium]